MPLLPTAIHPFSRHGLAEVGERCQAVAIFILIITFITADCSANSDFQPVAAGGDGALVQFCVYSPLGNLAHDS